MQKTFEHSTPFWYWKQHQNFIPTEKCFSLFSGTLPFSRCFFYLQDFHEHSRLAAVVQQYKPVLKLTYENVRFCSSKPFYLSARVKCFLTVCVLLLPVDDPMSGGYNPCLSMNSTKRFSRFGASSCLQPLLFPPISSTYPVSFVSFRLLLALNIPNAFTSQSWKRHSFIPARARTSVCNFTKDSSRTLVVFWTRILWCFQSRQHWRLSDVMMSFKNALLSFWGTPFRHRLRDLSILRTPLLKISTLCQQWWVLASSRYIWYLRQRH